MTIDLRLGDCLSVMAELPENSVDTIITDPPYGLTFMGKDWDRGVPGVAFWEQALRVAKPGAMLLAMGGTRTFHRLVCAIEDAGWEVRDSMAWLYGSGFPKSYDISKGIEKNKGIKPVGKKPAYGAIASRELIDVRGWNNIDNALIMPETQTDEGKLWHGWGTALKPAMELICVAMKPVQGTFVNNALTWGVAGLWIDGGRVGTEEELGRNNHVNPYGNERTWSVSKTPPQNNVGKAATGRWPANFIHDGSDEVKELFPNDAARFFYCAKASRSERNAGLEGMEERSKATTYGNGFNSETKLATKAQQDAGFVDRGKTTNHHPTVKPLALMRYLARLTKTPTGGVVLDPFMGSGTTGMAAVLEGRDFIGIELNAEYLEIAEKRVAHAQGSVPVELPLFAEAVNANTD